MFELPTAGIRLRAFRPLVDLEHISSLLEDAEVNRLSTRGFTVPQGERGKQRYREDIEKHAEMFCVAETITQPPVIESTEMLNLNNWKEPEFVGFSVLWEGSERGMRHSTFSIILARKFWGRGYGKEITRFMVDYAFRNLNMHRISLEVVEGNDRAIRLYQDCGFLLEGRQRKSHWVDGGWRDVFQMGILIDDWISDSDTSDDNSA
ncbi:acyl-CoA N-acyltransferase [Agrocybe pediades]|nr:acyl-CoA N-acyltransferase [Agrocybe pediades]